MKIIKYTKKNGSIVYRSNIYLGTDQVTGEKVKTTVTARTKKELKAKAIQAKAEFEKNGRTRRQAPLFDTYKDLVESWWDSYHHTIKPSSQANLRSQLNKYLLPAFGGINSKSSPRPSYKHR